MINWTPINKALLKTGQGAMALHNGPPSFYRSAAPESWAHLHNPSDYMWLGDAEQVPGGGKADYKAQWIDNSVDDFILHVRMPAFSIQISNVTFSNGWSYFLSEKTLKMTMF